MHETFRLETETETETFNLETETETLMFSTETRLSFDRDETETETFDEGLETFRNPTVRKVNIGLPRHSDLHILGQLAANAISDLNK